MNAPAAPNLTLPAIGAAFAGGFYLGKMFVGDAPYAIITAPREAQFASAWGGAKKVAGAMSVYDGLANTAAMAEARSKAAARVRDLRLGDFDDWYIPSRGEALLAFAANDRLPEAERFERDWYWTSTQGAVSGYAWIQYFFDGGTQSWLRKGYHVLVRAFRRQVI